MAKQKVVHVALLRAINVGGTGKLPMADLRRMFEDAGCEDVRTYIQSGNVVFRASKTLAKALPKRISDTIDAERGFRRPVILRSGDELRRVLGGNPFADAADPQHLHVAFLKDEPAKGLGLDPERSPGDRFALRGRELYLHYPNGLGRSKLDSKYIERRLETTSTTRSWRTVTKLVEMVG